MFERLKDLFTDNGWVVNDTETTSGADKIWFKREDLWSRDKVIEVLSDAGFAAKKFTDDFTKEIHGEGFEIILQHPEMCEIECERSICMFIAVHANSPRGKAYAHGFDC